MYVLTKVLRTFVGNVDEKQPFPIIGQKIPKVRKYLQHRPWETAKVDETRKRTSDSLHLFTSTSARDQRGSSVILTRGPWPIIVAASYPWLPAWKRPRTIVLASESGKEREKEREKRGENGGKTGVKRKGNAWRAEGKKGAKDCERNGRGKKRESRRRNRERERKTETEERGEKVGRTCDGSRVESCPRV